MSFADFATATEFFQKTPVYLNGEVVGAILTNGPEIHACILPKGFKRWCSRGLIRDTLEKIIKQHGYATTSVEVGNEVGDAFVKRWGFELTGTDHNVNRYRKNGN